MTSCKCGSWLGSPSACFWNLRLEPQVSKAASVKEGCLGGGRGQEPLTWSQAAKPEPRGQTSGPTQVIGRRWALHRKTKQAPAQDLETLEAHLHGRWKLPAHCCPLQVNQQKSSGGVGEDSVSAASLLLSKSCLRCLPWPMLTRN